jgi:GR25 family glycosyltransferase involved in LPS biosynthesis
MAFSVVEQDQAAAAASLQSVPTAPSWHGCAPAPECPHCNGTHPEALLDWSFLDAVYCISLKTRDDRVERVSAEFHRTGLCRYVRFYRPDKHPVKGIIGSWKSHRQVAMDALERGHRNALVFEDDVLFLRRITPKLLREVALTLARLPADWRIFYLGHWPVAAWLLRPNLLKTTSACAHAYIISPRLMTWLRDHPWGAPDIAMTRIIGRALDSAFSRLPGTYALFPMLATQSVSRSDNFNFNANRKPRTKLKHFITRSRYREALLSYLMRPAELIVTALSPFFWLRHQWRSWRDGRAG